MEELPEREIIKQTIKKLSLVVLDEVLHAEVPEYSSDHPMTLEIFDTENTLKYKSEIQSLLSEFSKRYDLEISDNKVRSFRGKNSQVGLAGLCWELLVLGLEEGRDLK